MEEKKSITRKIRPYIVGFICLLCFYSYEFIDDFSNHYYTTLDHHKKAKDNRTLALSKVKEFAKGSIVYGEYLKQKSITENFSNDEINEFKSDLVVSSAVIEHVGSQRNQEKMIENIFKFDQSLRLYDMN